MRTVRRHRQRHCYFSFNNNRCDADCRTEIQEHPDLQRHSGDAIGANYGFHFRFTRRAMQLLPCPGQFDKDDKPTKLAARRMIKMVLDLNKGSFNGQGAVSCFTCHRGKPTPVSVPAVGQNLWAPSSPSPTSCSRYRQ